MTETYTILYNSGMSKTMSLSQVRANLPSVVRRTATEEVFITIHGKPEAVITSAANYKSLIATLEVMSDPELVRDIDEGIKDIQAGKVHSWKDVKKELIKE